MTTRDSDTIPMVVRLPFELLERTERLVEQGLAEDREALLRTAIERFIAELEERASVDGQFAGMADDAEFRSLNLRIAEEFAASDDETLSGLRSTCESHSTGI